MKNLKSLSLLLNAIDREIFHSYKRLQRPQIKIMTLALLRNTTDLKNTNIAELIDYHPSSFSRAGKEHLKHMKEDDYHKEYSRIYNIVKPLTLNRS